MPLRSVEAATRDDAIAAAREQFGASARVVGVRRVRSGGVLGFFATERYVAEVDPEPAARPAVPVPAPARQASERQTSERQAAERRPARDDAASARSAVPARNGAAAWAAEARSTPSVARPARRDDEARVDELAGLLGQPAPTAFPRTAVSRPVVARPAQRDAEPEAPVRPAVVRPASVRPAWSELLAGTDAAEPEPAPVVAPVAPQAPADEAKPVGSAASPSPFTAALARMVAGDRDVQQAVEDALAPTVGEPSIATPGAEPTWSAPLPAAQTTVSPSLAAREEEPVELQDWTPSSASLVDTPVADWAAAEPTAVPSASREEAIAEVLRVALDEGRSDEALAGILRQVMDGASPSTALAETPVLETPAPVAAPMVVGPVAVEPVVVAPAFVAPAAEVPVLAPAADVEPLVVAVPVEEPLLVEPVATVLEETVPEVVTEVPARAEPVVEAPVAVEWSAPAPLYSSSELGWDDPVSSSLWAPVAAPADRATVAAEAPVEVEAQVEVPLFDEEQAEIEVAAAVEDTAVEETVLEDTAVEDTAVEDTAVEDTAVEPNVVMEAADAPFLARTASDPAPLSLDATTVMPPLSLLPPLPSSRRGGRPPVPPSVHRGSSARPVARPTPPGEEREAQPAADVESLATVTRLPLVPADEAPAEKPEPVAEVVAPVEAEKPAVVELDEIAPAEQTAVLPAVSEPVVERQRAARRPAVVVRAPAPRAERPRPVAASRPAPASAGDLVSGLRALGLPEDMLDAGFAADATSQGTYAALTRALAARLPETPELPSGAGEVLVVVGPGVETLRAARALAATLRLDTDRVQWATRGDLAGLVPAGSRMATVESAIERRQEAIGSGTLTIVAVDAPLRTDAYWTAQMLAIWAPVAVWAVVEATRKPEDLGPWIEGLPRVDALMVQDTDLSADPAAVLHRVALPLDLPVAVVDGMRATPHRWASLLCERLETPEA